MLDETVAGASVGGTLATNAGGPHAGAGGHRPRPADRDHGGPRGWCGGQGRRQRGEERCRLRPGQAHDRIVRHPCGRHRGVVPAPPDPPVQRGSGSRSTTRPRRTTWCSPSSTRRWCRPRWRSTSPSMGRHRHGAARREGRGCRGSGRTTRELLGEHAEVADRAPDWWSAYPWQAGETGLKLTCVLSGLRDVLPTAREVGASVRGSGAPACCTRRCADAERAVARPWSGCAPPVRGTRGRRSSLTHHPRSSRPSTCGGRSRPWT